MKKTCRSPLERETYIRYGLEKNTTEEMKDRILQSTILSSVRVKYNVAR